MSTIQSNDSGNIPEGENGKARRILTVSSVAGGRLNAARMFPYQRACSHLWGRTYIRPKMGNCLKQRLCKKCGFMQYL